MAKATIQSIIQRVLKSACTVGGNKRDMLMYDKASFKQAKVDTRPDCITNSHLCNLKLGEEPPANDKQSYLRLSSKRYPRPKPSTTPYHSPPLLFGSPIYICTKEQIRNNCPKNLLKLPKSLTSTSLSSVKSSSSNSSPPEKPPKFGPKSAFLLKAVACGCLCYFTYDIGVWGDTDRTQVLWHNITTLGFREPDIKPTEPCDEGFPPKSYVDLYNRSIKSAIRAIATSPEGIKHGNLNEVHTLLSESLWSKGTPLYTAAKEHYNRLLTLFA